MVLETGELGAEVMVAVEPLIGMFIVIDGHPFRTNLHVGDPPLAIGKDKVASGANPMLSN
jgi:hypothetical protein